EARLTRVVSSEERRCRKTSIFWLLSEKTRLSADEMNATRSPSPETLTMYVLSSAWVPSLETLTRVSTPLSAGGGGGPPESAASGGGAASAGGAVSAGGASGAAPGGVTSAGTESSTAASTTTIGAAA